MFEIATIWSFLSGAKRWFTKETLLAVVASIVALAIVIGFACIFSDIKSGAEARVNWKWLTQLSEIKRKSAERNEKRQKAIAEATAIERDMAIATLKETLESKATLEAELAKLKDNPVVYTRDERRRLFK